MILLRVLSILHPRLPSASYATDRARIFEIERSLYISEE